MTHRTLPPKADIVHLRKEAKRLYARLKAQAPEASLADAQFILAAEYGFKSWGRLKTAVEDQAAERWRARLALQEDFHAPQPQFFRARSLQCVWLSRQHELTGDDEPFGLGWETAWIHIGFLLLALIFGLSMTAG